ncbi:IgA peptidase M64-domain-containing protein [Desarmillaria tabescens]|uniref:IgA peptidase M64-domain-containing protein n=1 Tax=Armillaria tabescens TaxID=1929756 RepID=A0AA39T4V3_ARMTA|nr:IgA peptidase M64-domain-containing protein [Desarmillaria tabescens]KAK0464786.1 IgA peptidase M64-domain-containing protein [Desarmillaria tabescens]
MLFTFLALALALICGAKAHHHSESLNDHLSVPSHLGKCVRQFNEEYHIPYWYPDQETLDYSGVEPPPLEIEPLIISGPSSNRVDLVFFSDGYILEEREKFIVDAMRLAEDVSKNQTFNTVQPILNFWAAFTPSQESGVGVGGKPKNTTYGLYRPGTELRGVYYAKPEVAGAACSSMGDQCDFPILLGNDPLYGGLGGRYTVITSSIVNGPSILRHELGHSIILVGEEYDGGEVYRGVDAYHDLSEPVPWAHWLTNPPEDGQPPRVERSVMPLQDYAWSMLNTSKPWTTEFVSSGTFSRHLVRFSLSGLLESSDLTVELDGIDLGWVPKEGLGVDRWHYDVYQDDALAGGTHEVKFTLLNADREGIAQLCNVEILEFGDENEFIAAPNYYGVFPTYSATNKTSYRPTNEDCLMRLVTTSNFCKVCLEGLWHALLSKVNLIDDVTEGCSGKSKTLTVELIPLAQFRQVPIEPNESYTITWSRNGEVIEAFTNKTTLIVDENAGATYTVTAKYATTEVRVDKEGHLVDSMDYTVTDACEQ